MAATQIPETLKEMSIRLATPPAQQFGSQNAIVPGGNGVNPFMPQTPTPINTGPASSNFNTTPYKDASGSPVVIGDPSLNPALVGAGTTGTPVNGPPADNTTTTPGATTATTGTSTPGTEATTEQTTPQNVTDMLNTPSNDTSHLQQFGASGQANNPAVVQGLNDKYQKLFKQVQQYATPTSGGEARPLLQSTSDQQTADSATAPDPQQAFMDGYKNLNPVMKTIFDNIQKTIDSQATRSLFVDEYKKLTPDPGVGSLQEDQLALLNLNNIIDGRPDSIAQEINKVGGIAMESQIQAIAGARNKTLLKQAALLQGQIAIKKDYIDQIMHFTELDRAEVDKQVTEQLGLYEKEADIAQSMDNAASDAYWKMLSQQTTQETAQTTQYDKNLTSLGGDFTAFASTIPEGLKPKVESLMGLAPGTLSNPDELAYLTASSLKQQQLAQAGQKIQIQLGSASSLEQYRTALTELAGARTIATQATAVNSTIKSLYGTAAANPITAYRTASIWIGNVNAAYAKSNDPANVNKGPSDLELVDAAVKLNNGGQQVTQVQVDALQQAIGYPGKMTVVGGKVTGISGLLDSGTRTAIRDLATSNLIQKRIAATEATDNINSTLTSRGTPSNYNLPQIQAAMLPEGFVNQGTAADGETTVYLMPDGSVVDANGTNYDSDGNAI